MTYPDGDPRQQPPLEGQIPPVDGPQGDPMAGGDRWRSTGGRMFPFPSRSFQKGNSRVSVGGCCLPIPIGCLTMVGGVAMAGVSAWARGRG